MANLVRIGFVVCSLISFSLFAQVSDKAPEPVKRDVVAVIMKVVINAKKVMTTCEVAKVFDPGKSQDPIQMNVSDAYKKKACELASAKGPNLEKGKPVPFFTYFLLEPKTPDEVFTK